MSATADAIFSEGERVAGRYRVERLIAQGGMGAVYRAFDESSGQRVALKRRTRRDTPRFGKRRRDGNRDGRDGRRDVGECSVEK